MENFNFSNLNIVQSGSADMFFKMVLHVQSDQRMASPYRASSFSRARKQFSDIDMPDDSPKTLYVGNLDHVVSEDLLCALFSNMGSVRSCEIIREEIETSQFLSCDLRAPPSKIISFARKPPLKQEDKSDRNVNAHECNYKTVLQCNCASSSSPSPSSSSSPLPASKLKAAYKCTLEKIRGIGTSSIGEGNCYYRRLRLRTGTNRLLHAAHRELAATASTPRNHSAIYRSEIYHAPALESATALSQSDFFFHLAAQIALATS
ncbi:hypothetical protein ALC60_12638 [Trachymyrmex zeteki]|uniref:RRM domain-containing protein n=1 Tax=Mycetomoellerius zeteki TaxID=64791 RepID=A0A151WKG8_9HYME|nr:hypothetical protein ALC60_12638 [Trachymyrmex zeteki]